MCNGFNDTNLNLERGKIMISKDKKDKGHVKLKNDKKVNTVQDDNPNNKSLMYVIIGILIIVGVIGTILVMPKYLLPKTNVVEYNNYVFEKFEDNKWITQQLIRGQLYNIPFYYNPEQVLDIPFDPKSIQNIRNFRDTVNGQVYITVDPYESSKVVLASVEYARILGNAYNIYNMNVKSAISTPVDGNDGIPVITCDNQSKNVFVIYQTVTDKNLVSVDGNCIILESKTPNESIRVADAFSFRLLNIIKD
jgi:hypothetical protein